MGIKPRNITLATVIKKKLAAGPTRDDLVLALDEDFELNASAKPKPRH